MAERTVGRFGETGHHLRERRERAFAGEKPIEPDIGEEGEGETETIAPAVARPARRRDFADLGGDEAEAADVEGLTERQRHRAIAVPAHVNDAGFKASEGESRGKPGRRAAGV